MSRAKLLAELLGTCFDCGKNQALAVPGEEGMDRIAVGIVVIGVLGSAALIGTGFWFAERTTVQLMVWASNTFGPDVATE